MRRVLLLVLTCRSEQLPVRRYTKADGLEGNRVQCILRDSHGFLWFGTTQGLSRFDGVPVHELCTGTRPARQ
jgi:ligand-binding sensor domain-containing protein